MTIPNYIKDKIYPNRKKVKIEGDVNKAEGNMNNNDSISIKKDILNDKLKSGYYAVIDPTDGILKFYEVDIPEEGKWKGYIFLNVQASDELFPVKNRQHRYMILDEIRKDPISAMKRYGREIGSCGMCGRTLTDEISRQRGIGPICWTKVGGE